MGKQVVVNIGLIERTIDYLQELKNDVEGSLTLELSIMSASLALESLKRDLMDLKR